jgi:hypothetical protein
MEACNYADNKPSPPIVIPSETPTVLYCHASMLSFWMFFLISLPRSSTAVHVNSKSHAMLQP